MGERAARSKKEKKKKIGENVLQAKIPAYTVYHNTIAMHLFHC